MSIEDNLLFTPEEDGIYQFVFDATNVTKVDVRQFEETDEVDPTVGKKDKEKDKEKEKK